MKIAVLGAGNGGVAMAAHMVLKGHAVSLYDKFPEVLAGIQKEGVIYLKGAGGEGKAVLETVSTNIDEVIKDAELVMVVTPAYAHLDIAQQMALFMHSYQVVVLHPGRTGGALEFRKAIQALRPNFEPIIAEAQTLIYASRRTGPAEATIYGIKKRVTFAALPGNYNPLVESKLRTVFPEFVAVPNVLETSLFNIGAIFHPTPCILNSGRIEATQGNFEYYHEGITPAIAKVLEKIDEERIMVAKGLGVFTKSTLEWLREVYEVEGNDIYSAIQSNKVYSGIKAPGSLDTRYISEDVPMSLVPISELGKMVGIPTPTIDHIIDLANILHNKDYRQDGRTLERMGIANLSIGELKNFVS